MSSRRPVSEPFISATLIARNEAANVERCLSSFWADCDEVVIVDTGSTDGTVRACREFAKAAGQPDKLRVGKFKWVDDFSAARNYADSLATGTWLLWGDFDDEIIGLGELRRIAEEASPDVVAFFTHYTYAQDEHGNTISELWRERLVKRGAAQWVGRLHEHKMFTYGQCIQVDPKLARWVHHRKMDASTSSERNLRILTKWDHDEPDTPRIVQSLALEHLGANDWDSAIPTFRKYLALPDEPPDRRAQASRFLTQALLQTNQVQEAHDVAHASLAEHLGWADTYLSIAECAQTMGKPLDSYRMAKQALDIGKPESLLILNPLQYTAHPRAIMAVCAMQLGRVDEAMRLSDEVLEICPTYPLVAANLPGWRGYVLKEQTVSAFLSTAKMLVEHGEALKARRLLDCVPYFATDDPRVVQGRVSLWQQTLKRVAPEPLSDDAAGRFVLRHLDMAALSLQAERV